MTRVVTHAGGLSANVQLLRKRHSTPAQVYFLIHLSSGRASEPDPSALALLHRLTTTEQSVAKLVASGFDNQEIAAELWISVNTVRVHLYSIFRKLGVKSRGKLAVFCGWPSFSLSSSALARRPFSQSLIRRQISVARVLEIGARLLCVTVMTVFCNSKPAECSAAPGPFVTLRPSKRTLSASTDSGPTPRRAKSDFLSVRRMRGGANACRMNRR